LDLKRFVLAGASKRGMNMFAKPIVNEIGDAGKLVGIFDPNRTRCEYVRDTVDVNIPVYTDFDKMMNETSPDVVIVATIDSCHHEYIIKALEYGCDAITEKPMTTDEEKCNAIIEAEKRTGRKVTVTFNLRFSPYVSRIKELIRDGSIGSILSVDFEYFLDRVHGASYFRRWNRRKENSGGLLVHKSTHHFDLVNWWLDEEPEEVYANGTLRFYGPTREKRGERCGTCEFSDECEFFENYVAEPGYQGMYVEAAKEDGYYKDSCIFSDKIDIEDSMSVTVKYSKGTLLTYSLIAYSPYEGWRISINGTDGRIEAEEAHSGQGKGNPFKEIKVYNKMGEIITYRIKKTPGGHGGGDEALKRMLFMSGLPDPLGRCAGSYDGAKSLMIGVCANKSIKEKQPCFVKDLLKK